MRYAAAIAALLMAGCATVPPAPGPVRYVDAHSHLLEGMTAEQEIALFRAAGLAGVVIMHPDPAQLRDAAARDPGYVVPFISLARLPEMSGLRLTDSSVETMTELHTAGQACGFGEIPTRIMPRTEPTDDLSLLNPDRLRIYAAANRLGLPLNLHVDIADAAVAGSIERIARDNPRLKLILAHAGWSASPETIGRLMDAHPNIHADLSVRLDPAGGLPQEPLARGSLPPGAGSTISIVLPDGVLDPQWRELIVRHHDRFLFAMDVTQRERPKHIELLLATARRALAPLGRRIEQAVAHGNIERLLEGCRAGLARH